MVDNTTCSSLNLNFSVILIKWNLVQRTWENEAGVEDARSGAPQCGPLRIWTEPRELKMVLGYLDELRPGLSL